MSNALLARWVRNRNFFSKNFQNTSALCIFQSFFGTNQKNSYILKKFSYPFQQKKFTMYFISLYEFYDFFPQPFLHIAGANFEFVLKCLISFLLNQNCKISVFLSYKKGLPLKTLIWH